MIQGLWNSDFARLCYFVHYCVLFKIWRLMKLKGAEFSNLVVLLYKGYHDIGDQLVPVAGSNPVS